MAVAASPPSMTETWVVMPIRSASDGTSARSSASSTARSSGCSRPFFSS